MENSNQTCRAGLGVLLVLQLIMLAALLTRTPPHPPLAIPLFGLGPFLGASVAIIVAALIFGDKGNRAGQYTALLAAAIALVSFGPQKWFDPTFAEIWPAVILGEVAAILVAVSCVRAIRRTTADRVSGQ